MKADPIFALIEAHRDAYNAWHVVMRQQDAVEAQIKALGGKPASQDDKHPLMAAYDKRYNASHDVMDRAEIKLCRTRPATLAGISARMLYIVEIWNVYARPHESEVASPEGKCLELLLRSTAAAAEKISTGEKRAKVIPFRQRRKRAA